MAVSIDLPRLRWRAGQTIAVEVTAVNTTDEPVEIVSPSGAVRSRMS